MWVEDATGDSPSRRKWQSIYRRLSAYHLLPIFYVLPAWNADVIAEGQQPCCDVKAKPPAKSGGEKSNQHGPWLMLGSSHSCSGWTLQITVTAENLTPIFFYLLLVEPSLIRYPST